MALRPLACTALLPLLLAQGIAVRRRTPRLPEPAGERAGRVGSGPPLRLLILGDSAAAGVGAAHQREALSGALVAALAPRFAVDWRLEAHTGDRAADALAKLGAHAGRGADAVLVSLGVNDVTAAAPRARWIATMRALVRCLGEDLGARLVLLTALPPMHRFPALPQPLRWALGGRAQAFSRALADLAARTPGCEFLDAGFAARFDPRQMASDGFHPGPAAYRLWADAAAARIAAHFGRGVAR